MLHKPVRQLTFSLVQRVITVDGNLDCRGHSRDRAGSHVQSGWDAAGSKRRRHPGGFGDVDERCNECGAGDRDE